MADQHNSNIPAVGNQIVEDVADMKENFEWHKDVFQHICSGWSDTVLTGIGFYSTIWVPASAMIPRVTNGAQAGYKEYATNDIMRAYYAFDGTTEEYVHFSLPMPEGWDRSTVKAKFFWSSATGSTAGDTVEWEIRAGVSSDNDAIDRALGTAQVISDTLLADNGGDDQVTAATPALTVGGTPALGDIVDFGISRNVGGTDNMTEDAWLFGVWIQIKETFPDASGTDSIAAW